jgi:hypothetical protein
MRAAASFLALSRSDRALLLRTIAALVLVRFALGMLPLARLRAWAMRMGSGTLPVDRIVWAISAVSRRMSGTTCLVSAFALQRLLSREGHASQLHIGVAKREQKLAAHAWVVCEGRTLIGEYESDGYTQLLVWRVAKLSDGPSEPA